MNTIAKEWNNMQNHIDDESPVDTTHKKPKSWKEAEALPFVSFIEKEPNRPSDEPSIWVQLNDADDADDDKDDAENLQERFKKLANIIKG